MKNILKLFFTVCFYLNAQTYANTPAQDEINLQEVKSLLLQSRQLSTSVLDVRSRKVIQGNVIYSYVKNDCIAELNGTANFNWWYSPCIKVLDQLSAVADQLRLKNTLGPANSFAKAYFRLLAEQKSSSSQLNASELNSALDKAIKISQSATVLSMDIFEIGEANDLDSLNQLEDQLRQIDEELQQLLAIIQC